MDTFSLDIAPNLNSFKRFTRWLKMENNRYAQYIIGVDMTNIYYSKTEYKMRDIELY